MEVFRVPGVIFKILAEVQDEIIDGAGGWIYIIAPYRLQDFLAWYYFIFIFNQQFQQHGFFLTQLDLVAGSGHGFLCFEVDGVAAKTVCIPNAGFIQQFFVFIDQLCYAEQEFFQIEWFGEVIVRSFF